MAAVRGDSARTGTTDRHVLEVAHFWGDTLLEVRHFARPQPVTIGEAAGNAFTVFTPGVGARFTLAEQQGDGVALHLPQGAHLTLTPKDGPSHPRREASGTLALAPNEEACVALGTVGFRVRCVSPEARARLAPFQRADYTFFKVASSGVLALLALVSALLLTPPVEEPEKDIFGPRGPLHVLRAPPLHPLVVKRPPSRGAAEGQRARGDEGRRGERQLARRRPGDSSTPREKRTRDMEKVRSAGLLAAFGGKGFSGVIGSPGLGSGIHTAMEHLKGPSNYGAVGGGMGGLGSRGAGKGGGGVGMNLGGLGTVGLGHGEGGAGVDVNTRAKELVRVVPGSTTVVGGLDKDVIARVVQRRQAEVRYCYERGLQRTPDLGGKVAVQWTIAPGGAVTDAAISESTLADTEVERCILTRVSRWRFPEAVAGGDTVVTFPWVFKSAGDE